MSVEIINNISFRIKTKMTELSALHKKLLRPALSDEKSTEEFTMENLGQEISKLISTAHKNILSIKSHQYNSNTSLERKLIENIVRSLMVILQNQTTAFRNEQNAYLKQINSLEEYSNEFFDSLNFNPSSGQNEMASQVNRNTSVDTFDNFLNPNTFNASQMDDLNNDDRLDEYFTQMKPSQTLSQRQMLQFEIDNTNVVKTREAEVLGIVKSIVDLNVVYKDLSQLVEEQGTILDRIDYNIESTQTKVYEGFKQLQKAERYQRGNRKIYCIIILSTILLFLFVLLILTKF